MKKLNLFSLVLVASVLAATARAEKPKNVISIDCKNGSVEFATGQNAEYTLGSKEAHLQFGPAYLEKARAAGYKSGVNYMTSIYTTIHTEWGSRLAGVGGGAELKCDLPSKIEMKNLTKISCKNANGPVSVDDPTTIEIDANTVTVTLQRDDASSPTGDEYILQNKTVYDRSNCSFVVSKL